MLDTARRRMFPAAVPITLAVVAVTGACDSAPTAPTAALAIPAGSPTPLPPASEASPAVTSLAIEDAYAIKGPNWICSRGECHSGTGYLYEVRFRLRELSGAGGARVTNVVVLNPSPRPGDTYSQATGESCWQDPLAIPPGGTLDTFHTDAGSAWLSYCYVGIGGPPDVSSLQLEVNFVDDMQRPGSVSTTVTRFR